MQIKLDNLLNHGETIAVATSGGSDSMALLYYLRENAVLLGVKVVALNVEHGIRGSASVCDSQFVKDYCEKNSIPCISYSVDSLKKAKDEHLSVEQAARALRYECFYDAINKGKCDKVATAHHAKDNLESVLFNLFRGTGTKGLIGIKESVNNAIIRPFINVEKHKINEYVAKNKIPSVVDETNADDKYTRNYIRLNILPKIEEIFPDAETSVSRFCEIASIEDEYLDESAKQAVSLYQDSASIAIPLHKALFSRAVIKCLNHLGVAKDWEKAHIDGCYSLLNNENGSKINLPLGIEAVREYDKITFYREKQPFVEQFPFAIGKIELQGKTFNFERTKNSVDLKSGLFFDLDKVPNNAVIRFKQSGDVFTKFGGGTKDLNDYLCDKKIPLRMRNFVPLLAVENKVLLVFGVAVSEQIKVDKTTKNIIKFTEEN